MLEVGRLCIKLAGRDAGKKAVVVENIDSNFVLIDGQTRRRKCSISHLEPTEVMLTLKKGAAHKEVAAEFKKLNIILVETKPKTAKPRLRKVRKSDLKSTKEVKPKATKEVKKVAKKVVKKVAKTAK
ncbi:50S ribosomal protein L14e [Candidatus Woesearchaeota archaeon]|jgi:large subunit ribosomal protein L14e|nr:50S ribosomal protein L14e [Candidatus Woesearchaeota archaeon]